MLNLFGGLRRFQGEGVAGNVLAALRLASMDVPQVLGYARIAGMPLVAGLCTALLPTAAFALIGSSRHLVVAADPQRRPSCPTRYRGWQSPPAADIWRSLQRRHC
jgi:MFS superfamily sulfate permease-like transporter